MPFVVEDGSGRSDANSFASVAEADAYIGWTSISNATKEAALVAASRFIAQTYEDKWRGTRAQERQGLPWPRYNVYDRDGFQVGYLSVPRAIKEATFELAKRHNEGIVLAPDQPGGGTRQSQKVKVGPIEVATTFSTPQSGAGDSPTDRFPIVWRLISPLLIDGREVRIG